MYHHYMSLYHEIEQVLRAHQEVLRVSGTVTEEAVRQAVRWVMRNNPDIFWFVHQYRFEPSDGQIGFRYQFSQERSDLLQKSIDDVVANDFRIDFVRTLDAKLQVAYVYKWLLTYCNYNVNSAYNQTIDSVFVRRNSVCTGYAKAAQYLFKLLGMESRLLFGRLHNDREEGRHCWNLVCIDGRHYHLDICLGDVALQNILNASGAPVPVRYGDFNYNCFCVSTEEILKTRTIEDAGVLPPCNESFDAEEVEWLSQIETKGRGEAEGCLLTKIGSSADIFLCSKDKNTVLKKFRWGFSFEKEYGYMDALRSCEHLLQLNDSYTDRANNLIAIEQSTPIVDLFCSHYYHPTLQGVLKMIRDISLGWLECSERGLFYRDFHVCNIYRANNGVYKLGDFGSCAYKSSDIRQKMVGNQWFVSPETYIAGHFDERSAVYSITAVLYFILNGLRPPFVTDTDEESALRCKMSGEKLPPPCLLDSLPKVLAVRIWRLMAMGCAYAPSERMDTVEEFLAEINDLHQEANAQRIELEFVWPDAESIVQGRIIDVPIPRDVAHRFAYGEEEDSDDGETCCMTQEETDCMTQEETETPPLPPPPPPGMMASAKGAGGKEEIEEFPKRRNEAREINPERPERQELPLFTEEFSKPRSCFLTRIFRRNRGYEEVYSSVFAPAEVKRKSVMLVQLYLHCMEETETVKQLAKESQKDAERRDFIPLQCKLKKGDVVEARLNIYGDGLWSDTKRIVWQGRFSKCSFDYPVPVDTEADELTCKVLLSVNGRPVGEMVFVTAIVEMPRNVRQKVHAHQYRKIFISYSRKDEAKVRPWAEAYRAQGVDYFFDRHSIKPGDVFPKKIRDYINSADLFVLFWSENAAQSEYVERERKYALERAYPKVKPMEKAPLAIYPKSIEPRADLPADMKDIYDFEIS